MKRRKDGGSTPPTSTNAFPLVTAFLDAKSRLDSCRKASKSRTEGAKPHGSCGNDPRPCARSPLTSADDGRIVRSGLDGGTTPPSGR